MHRNSARLGPLVLASASGGRAQHDAAGLAAGQHLPTPESAPCDLSKAGAGSLWRSLAWDLASDEADDVTGHTLVGDGGLTMQ